MSAHLIGLSVEIITVEVDISNGLNTVSIVGLGDRSVEEAKDRISAAIKNSGYKSPKQRNQKVVISLAPASARKIGPSFDLPMAMAYLAATKEIGAPIPRDAIFLGELSLDGSLRKVPGILPILSKAAIAGYRLAFVPADNEAEGAVVSGMDVRGAKTLTEVIEHLCGSRVLGSVRRPDEHDGISLAPDQPDFSSVRGHSGPKRCLEIAVAGGHNALMYGPPGTGKTLLARCAPSIMPPLDESSAIEVTSLYSAAQQQITALIRRAPFRAPHHTSSYTAIVGGGTPPRPGEIALAHRGILFMDELPEFDRRSIEALRQPLEERMITVSRANGSATFPAKCILLASMNPCPCGEPPDTGCTCDTVTLRSYRKKLSAPIMDRIDLRISVRRDSHHGLAGHAPETESSASILRRVMSAREIQKSRYSQLGIAKDLNSELGPEDIDRAASLTKEAAETLSLETMRASLSGRAHHRLIKVARTIADLAISPNIEMAHISEAIMHRRGDEILTWRSALTSTCRESL